MSTSEIFAAWSRTSSPNKSFWTTLLSLERQHSKFQLKLKLLNSRRCFFHILHLRTWLGKMSNVPSLWQTLTLSRNFVIELPQPGNSTAPDAVKVACAYTVALTKQSPRLAGQNSFAFSAVRLHCAFAKMPEITQRLGTVRSGSSSHSRQGWEPLASQFL